MTKKFLLISISILLTLLSACGGGGDNLTVMAKPSMLATVSNTTINCGITPTTSAADQSIVGTANNDVLNSTQGNDTIDGLGGLNTVVYQCGHSNYTITKTTNGWAVTSAAEGTDTLVNIQRLQFTDQIVALDVDGNAGMAYRIYQAAFNRTPDNEGLKFWIAQLDNGASYQSVAAGFISSAEFQSLYGKNPSNGDFITKLYSNVLRRAPDPTGYAWWLNVLNTNQITQVGALMGFSESAENKSGVSAAIGTGVSLRPALVSTVRNPLEGQNLTRTFSDGSTEKVYYAADREVNIFTSAKGSITTTVVNAIEVVKKPIGTTSAYTIDYRFPNGTRTQLTPLDVSNTSIYQLTTNLDAVKDYGPYNVAAPSNTFKPESLCEYPKTNIIFPQTYMGQFPLPDIKAKPLKNGIVKAVGVSDSWGEMNSGCGGRSEFDNLDETFARLKAMGVQYAVYGPTVYYSRTDEGWRIFPETETGNSGSFATRDDFKKLIQIAGKYGIKLEWFPQMLRWDPAAKTQRWTPPAKTASELRGFLMAYEAYLIDLAKYLSLSNAGGLQLGGNIYGLDLNLDMDIERQNEYISFLKQTLPQLRRIFSGEIVFSPPGNKAEIFAQIPEIANNINAFIIGTSGANLAENLTQYNIATVKNSLNINVLPKLIFANKFNVPVYLSFGVGSKADGIIFYDTGFCLSSPTSGPASTDGTCFQRQVVPDFSFQALYIEGVFEWLKENEQINIGRIQVEGYQHIDQLIPTNWFPSLEWSIRNKPAELIVKSWYLSKN